MNNFSIFAITGCSALLPASLDTLAKHFVCSAHFLNALFAEGTVMIKFISEGSTVIVILVMQHILCLFSRFMGLGFGT